MAQKTLDMEGSAQTILAYSRKKLALEFPALLPAIYLLTDQVSQTPGNLFTDGTVLYYHPKSVVESYLQKKNSLAEQLLHIITHGLLGHFGKREGQQPLIFDAAADIKAAGFIGGLGQGWSGLRGAPQETRLLLESARDASLESLYLSVTGAEQGRKLIRDAAPLYRDDHSAWERPPDGRAGPGSMDLQSVWDMVAQQVASQLAQQGMGHLAGEMSDVYRSVGESGVSYREFLRQFCAIQERQCLDPDSLDRIRYHVGLKLTGDTPIVEPQELREDMGLLELAVALDTSGSCCGQVMTGFLGELLAILRDTGGPRVELTLIQCDADVQNVRTLTREDNAEEIMEGFRIYGCGGTDFRPVFDYILQQREDPEGKRFRGLLYLSDGYGSFPDEAPDYPVAFLFPREEEGYWHRRHVPGWVQQVDIREDTLVIRKHDTED